MPKTISLKQKLNDLSTGRVRKCNTQGCKLPSHDYEYCVKCVHDSEKKYKSVCKK